MPPMCADVTDTFPACTHKDWPNSFKGPSLNGAAYGAGVGRVEHSILASPQTAFWVVCLLASAR